MITFLSYAMIIIFIYLLTKQKLTVYSALALVPVVFGVIACLITGKPMLDILT
jgi:citrate-Mg2+:H+ or citrate-Ca2+:H+ symporter, CitMHS family